MLADFRYCSRMRGAMSWFRRLEARLVIVLLRKLVGYRVKGGH